jgi:hypothetical protein
VNCSGGRVIGSTDLVSTVCLMANLKHSFKVDPADEHEGPTFEGTSKGIHHEAEREPKPTLEPVTKAQRA